MTAGRKLRRAGPEEVGQERVCKHHLFQVVRGGLTEQVTLEQRPKGGEG